MTYPGSGPPLVSSKTWCGFNSFLKLYSRSRPFRPPLFGFTNTRSGQQFRGILEAITAGITTAFRGLSLTTVSLTSIYILSASEKHEIWSTTAPVKRHQNYFLYFLLLLENRSHYSKSLLSLLRTLFSKTYSAVVCYQLNSVVILNLPSYPQTHFRYLLKQSKLKTRAAAQNWCIFKDFLWASGVGPICILFMITNILFSSCASCRGIRFHFVSNY